MSGYEGPAYQQPEYQYHGEYPKKKRSIWPWLLIIGAVMVLGCSILTAFVVTNDSDPQADPAPVASTTATPAPAKKVAPKVFKPTDGTWAVPGEVKPGTYVAVVPDDLFDFCGWFVRTGPDPEDVRDFGSGNKGDRMRVTIKATDKEFESKGCGTWTKVG